VDTSRCPGLDRQPVARPLEEGKIRAEEVRTGDPTSLTLDALVAYDAPVMATLICARSSTE
jgi:hypothetical protein